jgi:hypothetical protein
VILAWERGERTKWNVEIVERQGEGHVSVWAWDLNPKLRTQNPKPELHL